MKKHRESRIQFHYLFKGFRFSERARLKKFLLLQFKINKRRIGGINYIFCNDKYLHGINKTYLKHDTYTDIISFDLSSKHNLLVADIYISVERVKSNAMNLGYTFKQELHRVIFHGALHLIGYNDKSESERREMRYEEDAWLKKYFVPREK